jgi:uncharacterized protein with ATP-grasp and redox domains
MDNECKQCLIKSFEKILAEKSAGSEIKNKLSVKIRDYVYGIDSELVTPEAAREINKLLVETLNISDLHKEEKLGSNDIALNNYHRCRELVLKSASPFNAALRLSIAGNIMDYAACPEFFTNSEQYFDKMINEVLTVKFAIDNSKELEERIHNSKTLLFLGDNAGEIVMDKLLLETIGHPNVYYAVRDRPVINDVTSEDAYYTGINTIAKIISNGYDAPSTIIEKASGEFIAVYNDADLIISKGQGNLEGLTSNTREDLFFLLIVKCDVIARLLGVKKGDYVVKKNNRYNNKV